ncbi:LysR family transcriptional regulator [Permianibacter aggregans]|uniref:DNA-binding transcriptional LysR family regulator n=1 Tax=Permianibacter aggregans TaxID=1510150 RepID=A0A4R6UMX1_9GAMM|nr:LysR family transcriptional regulator [Permianibacter aggregans]QGX41125.1 LysR family transcriptional regulator [Permianibacter aggregans]TDQ44564.1 DNA-binding transcriptional LysR family regulator [Permianibacter aggregans]
MKLSLDALLVLDAIEREGSFALAAERLNRVPSALTYTVRKLEEDLDVLLFDRRGRKAELTVAGRDLLEQGRELLKAAGDLECRVKRVATGWETELRIAVDGVLPLSMLWPFVAEFQKAEQPTRLHFLHEILGGSWEAIRDRRADIVIGAPGEMLASGDFAAHLLGELNMLLAMAPTHPLAGLPEPLEDEQIRQHRIIAVADSSRHLPPRTLGILDGQETLTVPNLHSKISAQQAGLGIGFLPEHLLRPFLSDGSLVTRRCSKPKPASPMFLLHPKRLEGNAMKWWVKALKAPGWWQSVTQMQAAEYSAYVME